ncbi:hypothetical protein BH11MYX4_BH11MYX4_19120 [soil metagenome]
MRLASSLALLSLIALGAASAGCPAETGGGSSGTSGAACDYSPPTGFDALSPAVSFTNDVLPVFAQSCAFSTCHGSTTGPANGVFLGRDGPKVHAAIVNVKGDELPTMPFVTPGNPRESYLMRKMDGSQCALDAQCTGASCGSSMPKGDAPLEVARRDIVRRWIAQGAKND